MIVLFNPFETQYTLEKGYWLESKLKRLNMAGYGSQIVAKFNIKNLYQNQQLDT